MVHHVGARKVENATHRKQTDDDDGHDPQRVLQSLLEAGVNQLLEQGGHQRLDGRAEQKAQHAHRKGAPLRAHVGEELVEGGFVVHVWDCRIAEVMHDNGHLPVLCARWTCLNSRPLNL